MDLKPHPDSSNPWAETHHRGRARMAALGAITHEVAAASKSWIKAGFSPEQWSRLEDRGIGCFVKLESLTNVPDPETPTFGFMRLDREFFERLAHAIAACPKSDGKVSLALRPHDLELSSGASPDQWNLCLEVERATNADNLVHARLHGYRRGGLLLSADIVPSDLMAIAHHLTTAEHPEPTLASGYSDTDNELVRLERPQGTDWQFDGVVHGLAEPSRFATDDVTHLLVPSKIDGDDDEPLSVELNRLEAPAYAPVWQMRAAQSFNLQVCNGVLFWPGDDGQEDLETLCAILSSKSDLAEREFKAGLRHRALMQMAKATSMKAQIGDVPYLIGDVISSAGRGVEAHLQATSQGLDPDDSKPAPTTMATASARRPMRLNL